MNEETGLVSVHECEILLMCSDLSEPLDYYTRHLGFRLDSIFPADNPRVIRLSGHGVGVQLRRESVPGEAPTPRPDSVIMQAFDAQSWGEGRAGMQYRDLVPGRLGGRYIASHIRIPKGGPVADYVHHHHIDFQMIYCLKGWVRVVYEDQGEPFVMHPGDCVLQPPHIRHRVLECSDGMEVIEIGSPAEHETLADYSLNLPTTSLDRSRSFEGQRFVFHQACKADRVAGSADFFEYRDIGIAQATGNLANALVLRPSGFGLTRSFCHGADFFFNFLLAGSATLRISNNTKYQLGPADCFVIPAGLRFVFSEMSPDFELLQVTMPGNKEVIAQPTPDPFLPDQPL